MTPPFIRALVKDPHWLYAWWDLDIHASYGSSIVLRVHDVTDLIFDGSNSRSFIQIDTHGKRAGDWYIHVPLAARVYVIEGGLMSGDAFRPLCQSNAVPAPPDGPSSDTTQRWTTIHM